MTSPWYITEYHEEVWQGDLTKKKTGTHLQFMRQFILSTNK